MAELNGLGDVVYCSLLKGSSRCIPSWNGHGANGGGQIRGGCVNHLSDFVSGMGLGREWEWHR